MRDTTLLLNECIKINALVYEIESYLMGPDPYLLYSQTRPAVKRDEQMESWLNVGRGGHAELIIDRVSQHPNDCRDVVIGVCMSGDIEMIKTIRALGVYDFNSGFNAFIYNYRRDMTGHNVRVVELLFDFGGFAVPHNGQLVNAAKQGDVDMCRLLISKGFLPFSMWPHAGYRVDNELFEFAMENSYTLERFFFTLSAACEYGRLDFVKHITKKYMDVTLELINCKLLNNAIISALTGDIYNDAEHDDFSMFTNDHADVIEYLLTFNTNASKSLSKACYQGAAKSFAVLSNAGFKNCDCGLDIASHTPEYLNRHRLRNLEYVASVWESR